MSTYQDLEPIDRIIDSLEYAPDGRGMSVTRVLRFSAPTRQARRRLVRDREISYQERVVARTIYPPVDMFDVTSWDGSALRPPVDPAGVLHRVRRYLRWQHNRIRYRHRGGRA